MWSQAIFAGLASGSLAKGAEQVVICGSGGARRVRRLREAAPARGEAGEVDGEGDTHPSQSEEDPAAEDGHRNEALPPGQSPCHTFGAFTAVFKLLLGARAA